MVGGGGGGGSTIRAVVAASRGAWRALCAARVRVCVRALEPSACRVEWCCVVDSDSVTHDAVVEDDGRGV